MSRSQQRSFLESANAEAADSREDAQRRQQAAQEAARAVQSREQHAELSRRGAMQLMLRAGQIRNEQAQAEASLAGLERESERLIAESQTAREELAALGLQQGQVRMSFETVSERLKRVELEISELRLSIEASHTEESETKRRGDTLRGEVASLNGRRSSLEGLIRDHSYSTDTVKNIFKVGAKQRVEGAANDTLGTLADFLEVDGAYEQVVDEFLRDELNYIVVKNWDGCGSGHPAVEVRGRRTRDVPG